VTNVQLPHSVVSTTVQAVIIIKEACVLEAVYYVCVVWGCCFLQLRRLTEVIRWGYDMDYVWCCWKADCQILAKVFFCFCGTQLRTFTATVNVSVFSLFEAYVKPIQALTAYVSFAKMTALNTLCRHSRFGPCARNVFNANIDWAQLLSIRSTCSFTVRVFWPSLRGYYFMISTRLISATSTGHWVEFFRRLCTNMTSSDVMRFNCKLLASDQCSTASLGCVAVGFRRGRK